MPIDVPMPKLGLTMEEATIIDWLVEDGAFVAVDQPIMLIETDKTETEVGAPGAGRLHQMGGRGDVFACGARVAILLAEGEEPPAAAPLAPTPAPVAATPSTAAAATSPLAAPTVPVVPANADGRLFASPNARRVAAERGVPLRTLRGSGPNGRIVSEDVESAPAGGGQPETLAPIASNRSAVASVAARQLADLLGIDLALVPVDAHERRVTRDGVARYVRERLAPVAPPTPAAAEIAAGPLAPLTQEPTKVLRLSGMRGTIARRMKASLGEMAQLTLTMDAEMSAVLAHRAARRQAEPSSTPSITDYVVAATARALVRHPYANAQVFEGGIAHLPGIHVGLAVAVEGGLLVPTIRDTAGRDLADLAAETSRLAAAARSGGLAPADLDGGTFSVSALGAFGVDMFTPVINPPNAGILGVGRLRDELVLVDGAVTTSPRMTLSLTWDHRVFDGVPAAEFCRSIVSLLAEPDTLDIPEA